MKILVINAGSSSMKYQLINMEDEQVIAKGNCERIGNGGLISYKTASGASLKYEVAFPTHAEALQEILKLLTTGETRVIDSIREIDAVGHRTVHGGEKFTSSVLITNDVLDAIDELSSLAPLHNPPGLAAIRASQNVFGKDTPMVAVFDTSFHQTMPPKAYMYALPYEYYKKYGIRRYGFHGTSHRFVTGRLAELTGRRDLKIVSCHLGNGSSITAVDAGKSIDTSLGMSTNEGVMMGTRSGRVDPGIIGIIADREGLDFTGVTEVLQKHSGLEGISGVSSDMRDLHTAVEQGNDRAKLAVDMLCYQIQKFIASYIPALGGLDAVIFTGGIGENDDLVRAATCDHMESLGIKLDPAKNSGCRSEARISADDSPVQVWVIPTNEELLIARDTRDIVSKK